LDSKKGFVVKMAIDYRSFFNEWKDWEEFEPRTDGIKKSIEKHRGQAKYVKNWEENFSPGD